MPFLFAVTLFISAALLFLIEPMIAKMILPRFGGTPAVWITCMVFFQAALLAGYGYAHLATKWLGLRRQAGLHVLWLLLPAVSLPIGVAAGWSPQGEENPTWLLLGLLIVSIGLPFFVVATSAPLLQKWFAGTGHPAGRDPYFLYAASNLGSMLALLSYPVLVEPNLTLSLQGKIWAVGYGLLAILTLACIWVVYKSPDVVYAEAKTTEEMSTNWGHLENELTWPRRLRWVALAFVPSSLMLGLTTYLSTDIAPIPLIWVIPLALYLLSFILVFSRLPWWIHSAFRWSMPVLVLVLIFMMMSGIRPSYVKMIPVHLGVFFVVAMACHGELARTRPSPLHLTEFYLWMSLGGVLGGLFNALVAPTIFQSVQEYPLAMILACMLMPGPSWTENHLLSRVLDVAVPLVVAGLAWGMFYFFDLESGKKLLGGLERGWQWFASLLGDKDSSISIYDIENILQFGIPIVICYACIPRPFRCGLAAGALLLARAYYPGFYTDLLKQDRNFFGVLRVDLERKKVTIPAGENDDDRNRDNKYKNTLTFHELLNGTTLHGSQLVFSDQYAVLSHLPMLAADSPAGALVLHSAGQEYWSDLLRQPISYYHSTGPVADLFRAFSGPWKKKELAFIGLGTGTLLSYGETGQKITVYEINPAVVRIAENPEYFTFASQCRADPWPDGRRFRLVMGDARLSLEREPDGRYGIIMVDAFSSDAIPVHLITREAIELYLKKLAPHGIIALHISNRYLKLDPVTATLAKSLDLAGIIRSDELSGDDDRRGKSSSTWVLLARDENDLYPLTENPEWWSLSIIPEGPLWTDDFSNIFRIFRWKRE
ncbi:MAG TPA: fused MFS/spermidine synthase [Gemmataceae bacterium]|nr:fused MFS/spermidine synthase [Gemmataceae bacterium]